MVSRPPRALWYCQLVALLTLAACSQSSPTSPSGSSGSAGNSSSSAGASTQPPRIARTRYMAFGDSIVAGEVTAPNPLLSDLPLFRPTVQVLSAAFPTVLEGFLKVRYAPQAANLVVFNEGRGAEPMSIAMPRFLDTSDAEKPDVVLLLGGYNDINAQTTESMDIAATALRGFATEAKRRGARVFIATLTPGIPNRQRSSVQALVLGLNDRIRSIAASDGLGLVDIYPIFTTNVDTYIGIDGLHPTEIGYRRIAEAFFNAIVKDLEVK